VRIHANKFPRSSLVFKLHDAVYQSKQGIVLPRPTWYLVSISSRADARRILPPRTRSPPNFFKPGVASLNLDRYAMNLHPFYEP